MFSNTAGGFNAPDFPDGLEWINSPPMKIAQLKGSVVLLEFWDYTCINCIRTIGYSREWHRRYSEKGLVIIGVHTPEFWFGKDPRNVNSAIRKYGINYPVVMDNDYDVWSLYSNQYWPRKYLIDDSGCIVYDHAGEGDYLQTEHLIQQFLKRNNSAVKLPELYRPGVPQETGSACYPSTPEIYFGYERGRMGSREGFQPEMVVNYKDDAEYADGLIYASGSWVNLEEGLRHAVNTDDLKDYVAVKYHASNVYIVFGCEDSPSYRAYIIQDGKYVNDDEMGEDLKKDEQGRTYLDIASSRLYRIIKNKKFGAHTLKIYSDSESFEIYSITFGSCEIQKKKSRSQSSK